MSLEFVFHGYQPSSFQYDENYIYLKPKDAEQMKDTPNGFVQVFSSNYMTTTTNSSVAENGITTDG